MGCVLSLGKIYFLLGILILVLGRSLSRGVVSVMGTKHILKLGLLCSWF